MGRHPTQAHITHAHHNHAAMRDNITHQRSSHEKQSTDDMCCAAYTPVHWHHSRLRNMLSPCLPSEITDRSDHARSSSHHISVVSCHVTIMSSRIRPAHAHAHAPTILPR